MKRRHFISTGLAASSLAFPHIARCAAPNQKLNLAIIGVGGRGGANLGGVAKACNIVGLCDTNPGVLANAKKRFPMAKVVSDWRKVVSDNNVDGVVVSTADHHHALVSLAAMRQDKHVYCEKPLAHTVREARLMQDEYLKRKDRIATQMGTQIHARPIYRRVVELIQAGAIGQVSAAHVWCSRGIRGVDTAVLPEEPVPEGFDWDSWLGPAPDRPYNTGYWKGGNLNWNRRWEFGNGVLGDMGSHLIDLPWWALELHRPLRVSSEGPPADDIACPPWQVVTWDHKGKDDQPLKVVWYHGAEGMKRRAALLQPMLGEDTNLNKWGIGVAFVGSEGVLVADYGKLVLSPSAKFESYERPAESIAPSMGHYNEWIKACETGGASLCNFDYSGALIEHNLLGNVAHRAGKTLDWNAKEMRFPNAPEAEKLLTKSYRKGWDV